MHVYEQSVVAVLEETYHPLVSVNNMWLDMERPAEKWVRAALPIQSRASLMSN